MAKTTTATCVLFMVLMAFAIQESEATVILKSILLYKLFKKLTAKKAPVVAIKASPVPVPVPAPIVTESKPVYARVTAGTKPQGYEAPSSYESNFGDGRRL